MTATRLPVVLLWHMHQPQYRDALTGQYVLPWTYLHAIKDYTDMAAHLEENPRARAVVNFTPVLLAQLEELSAALARHFADGTPLPDPLLAALGPAPLPTDAAERAALMRACLRAHRKNLIERHAPYLELATLAETLATEEAAGYASDTFIHDLATWYHLAWLGETVRRTDPRVPPLENQGRHFTTEQRRALLALIGELIQSVIPRYRALAASGRCELSVTPYAHPIIPLLCDFRAARESVPDAPLPRHPGYPGGESRAAWHVAQALSEFERHFGQRPRGCWPAEGAISARTLQLLDAQGFAWAASGANVLHAALAASGDATHAGEPTSTTATTAHAGDATTTGTAAAGATAAATTATATATATTTTAAAATAATTATTIAATTTATTEDTAATDAGDGRAYNRPYQVPGQKLRCFFREDGLSDIIGFTYSSWHGDDAAHDFVNRVLELAHGVAAAPGHVLLIALDGENAWEYYPFNGYYFLKALYAGLADHPELELTTLSQCVDRGLAPLPLRRVVAGSWVQGTLATWMGDADKNAAWDLLCDAKLAYDEALPRLSRTAWAAAQRQLALCESSDWFWWFGDYNPAEAVQQFDRLYRRQLANLYRLLGMPVPPALSVPICEGRGSMDNGGVMRRAGG